MKANAVDLEQAEKNDLPDSLIRRLDLRKADKYDSMLQGILDVGALEDPVGTVTLAKHLDDGLDLYRVTCPVGVLLVIFEARPEVIANITALAIKSGNAAILKGGKESLHTFEAMSNAVTQALKKTSVPPDAIRLVSTREQVGELLQQDRYIDMVIPRGSNDLVRHIKSSTRIPVLGHADGICSIYVHSDANPEMAARVVTDSKINYPAACNAVETLLINKQTPFETIHMIAESLTDNGVTIKADKDLFEVLTDGSSKVSHKIVQAEEADFDKEFLSLTLAAKFVDNVEEAIAHINEHGSGHTDTILTLDKPVADKFLKGVDSAGIFWNASTRFADGFRYGFGTEVGVSTNKLHARGPVGLDGLMSYQYQLRGNGQIAGDYLGAGGERRFKHLDFIDEL